MIIEWDHHLEFLCIFSPLRPEPNQTLVAIILPDLTGLTDRVLAPPKEQVDKIAHEPTNAPKPIEPHPQSPTRSQIVGKPMSKENTVVSPERQEIHESQAPQVGDILTAHGRGSIDAKPGGRTIVLIRYDRKRSVKSRIK